MSGKLRPASEVRFALLKIDRHPLDYPNVHEWEAAMDAIIVADRKEACAPLVEALERGAIDLERARSCFMRDLQFGRAESAAEGVASIRAALAQARKDGTA